ncbi:DUF6900 domain-containing protein [Gluconacetobacter dulcium]|uniref:DUF6900 domain-containing protein n=1 Tax=Gluconacetobacter dulcium TaxID=2729096 RepID=UPI0035C858EF
MTDEQLLKVITGYSGFRAIEPKNNDQEDFKSIYIGNLVKMLKHAYELGKRDGIP